MTYPSILHNANTGQEICKLVHLEWLVGARLLEDGAGSLATLPERLPNLGRGEPELPIPPEEVIKFAVAIVEEITTGAVRCLQLHLGLGLQGLRLCRRLFSWVGCLMQKSAVAARVDRENCSLMCSDDVLEEGDIEPDYVAIPSITCVAIILELSVRTVGKRTPVEVGYSHEYGRFGLLRASPTECEQSIAVDNFDIFQRERSRILPQSGSATATAQWRLNMPMSKSVKISWPRYNTKTGEIFSKFSICTKDLYFDFLIGKHACLPRLGYSRGPVQLLSSKKAKIAQSASEWTLASDDAWDSASDSESAYRSPSASRLGYLMGTSSAKPIPVTPSTQSGRSPSTSGMRGQSAERSNNGSGNVDNSASSASSITFSYTHVHAPSPSSSYAKQSNNEKPTGWTMISNSGQVKGVAAEEGQKMDQEIEEEMELEDSSFSVGSLGRSRRIREGKEAIKYDVEDIVNGKKSVYMRMTIALMLMATLADPLRAVHSPSLAEYEERVASGIGHPEMQHQHAMRAQKRQKFVDCLTAEDVNMTELRKLAWSGIPEELRPIAWMLLLVRSIPGTHYLMC
ncbi:9764_t:CDS:2 [Acaulospora colombiana]|uniref:9764_t:CDS:1 n=1 Tax=Acaulospora colombiana TaxID=27376 RepID=A0ACA9NZ24_9GLOM|nr:9764_t:CDS:2 [Acaulospora colombiana]